MNETALLPEKLKHSQNESDIKYNDVQNTTPVNGSCCVCRKAPTHSRIYYGRLFCINCFHKYIWSPPKKDCSGDVENLLDNAPVQDT